MSLVLNDAKDVTQKDVLNLGNILIRGNNIQAISLPIKDDTHDISNLQDLTDWQE